MYIHIWYYFTCVVDLTVLSPLVNVSMITTACYYWDEENIEWSAAGVMVSVLLSNVV